MSAIETCQLRREYVSRRKSGPRRVALDGVNLAVELGETAGLLGPNGAGKTTLVKILSTVLLPTAGSARVLGFDVVTGQASVKPLIGLVFGGDRGLYTRVSARRNLMFWAALYRLPHRVARRRCEQLLQQFGLSERADEPVERFSRGMKQRLHLARGLIHQPPVLFLDEPTAGLDPAAAHDLRVILGGLKSEGRTILLATHDMAEAETLCDRVTLIDHGCIKASAPTADIGQLLSDRDRVDFVSPNVGVARAFGVLPGVEGLHDLGQGRWRAHLAASHDRRCELIAWLAAHGIADIQTSRPSLEEVYLHVLKGRGMLL